MLTNHDFGDGCHFLCGRLPDVLVWNDAIFDEVWHLHPADKHKIMIHGHLVETPRWQQAYGANYPYTGRVNFALPVPDVLQPLLDWGQATIFSKLNGLLLNWYEGSDHYIGEHHDSVKNMIRGAPIVTVSFGETRIFRLTKGKKDEKQTKDFPAPHGTVFVMPYETNRIWKHGVPKSTKYIGRRISVTFRAFERGVVPQEKANVASEAGIA